MKKHVILSVSLALLTGCLRGETKSLDEIFSIAKAQYSASSREGVPADAVSALDSVQKNLESAMTQAGGTDVVKTVSQISESLSTLLPQAGYTVRPALTELRNQYLELSKGEHISVDELKLLESRTYSLLAEELSAQKFGIK